MTHVRRRTVLKGIGASLTLPFLPSLAWAGGGPAAEMAGPPRRLAFLMMSNGVSVPEWGATVADGALQLKETLAPLQPLAGRVTVLENLFIDPTITPKASHMFFNNFLAGTATEENRSGAAITFDQILAQHPAVGRQTPLGALNLAIEPPQVRNKADDVAGSFYINWRSAESPVSPLVAPRQAYNRLFDTATLTRDRSVLDAVLPQAQDLRRDLGLQDRRKLDEYMASVRSVEQRMDRLAEPRAAAGWQPTLVQPDMDPPREGIDFDLATHVELMTELMALAFQADKTRIATFLMASDASYNVRYDFLEGVGGDSLHNISHHGNKPKKMREHHLVNRWHVEQLRRLAERMAAIDEGGSSLLDNTMLCFGSNMMDGNRHDYTELPLILLGGERCGLQHGTVRRYEDDEQRRVANLWLDLCQRTGAPVERIGTSTGPLGDLG